MSDRSAAVAIVGLGHAGLVVANDLARRSIGFVAYDPADRVGDVWRQRYRALRLNTEAAMCALPGHPLPSDIGRWPSARRWADYLADVAADLGIEPVPATVRSITTTGDGWQLSTDTASATFAHVVVATGRARTPVVPAWDGAAGSSISILHSSGFDRGSSHADERVLVVGSGNSGTEIANELAGHASSVALSIRSKPVFVRRMVAGISSTRVARVARHLPDRLLDFGAPRLQRAAFGDLRPYGLAPPDLRISTLATNQGPTFDAGFLDSVRAGRIRVVADIGHLDDDRVHLTDGAVLAGIDTIIAATGYGSGLDRFVPATHLDTNGWPKAAGAPFQLGDGLFFAGFAPATLTGFMPDNIADLGVIASQIAAG